MAFSEQEIISANEKSRKLEKLIREKDTILKILEAKTLNLEKFLFLDNIPQKIHKKFNLSVLFLKCYNHS